MSNQLKFPPSVEIKRVIAAAQRAGVEIASVDIHPRKIMIHALIPADAPPPTLSPYELWKLNDSKDQRWRNKSVRNTDAPPKKPRT